MDGQVVSFPHVLRIVLNSMMLDQNVCPMGIPLAQ